jgi:large subunit ribosomal protein L29
LSKLRAKELRQQDETQLRNRLFELRGDLSKLRSSAARGMIQKQSGNIKRIRKDVARILTVMKEKGVSE